MTSIKTLPHHRNGIREVLVDCGGMVLSVISATRISYTPELVTTYQRPTVDGFVVRATNCNGKAVITLNRFVPQLSTISPVTEDDDLSDQIISKLDPDLISWLEDVVKGEQSNLLPAGFGWDGVMTSTEYNKHARICDLFVAPNDWSDKDGEWFKHIANEAVRTSNMYLKLDWDDSFKLINRTIPIQRFLPTETKVYVVTFDKVGNRTLHLVRRPIHVGSTKPPPEVFVVPKDAVKAILLRTQVMVDIDKTYGVSIDLFK